MSYSHPLPEWHERYYPRPHATQKAAEHLVENARQGGQARTWYITELPAVTLVGETYAVVLYGLKAEDVKWGRWEGPGPFLSGIADALEPHVIYQGIKDSEATPAGLQFYKYCSEPQGSQNPLRWEDGGKPSRRSLQPVLATALDLILIP